ncbi:MAG TPA: DUF4082 domain-containing protein [Verrucomicrobiae bacterium]|nr:DUF4082 domain-containing protein [Verrucomicrobiae bacterium]
MRNTLHTTLRRATVTLLSAMLLAITIPFTATALDCPCSLWGAADTPAVLHANDTQAVELGVNFQTNVAGVISGIRFYKGPENTGTHRGSLWSESGTLLARATFSNESASGWQQVYFDTPVTVTAHTTYVASYYAPNGNYSYNAGQFNEPKTNGPLTAPANNGVFSYANGGGFPTTIYNNTNYWVDVIFTDATGPDTTPPSVTMVTPAPNSANNAVTTSATATFNEAMQSSSVSEATVELRDTTNTLIPATISYNQTAHTVTIDPVNDLAPGATYAATIKGGLFDPRVKDAAGNALTTSFTWQFTTAQPSVPSDIEQGPGGPILAITANSRPFSKYYAEILRAEGLNLFETRDITEVTSSSLSLYEVVIIGDLPLTTTQVAMLSDWVHAGGNLIAMRPDKKLSELLGLTDANTTLSDAYLRVNSATNVGAGIVTETMQFHGTADAYTAQTGTTVLASLYATATNTTAYPAVTVKNVGSGQAAAFTYDLARSVIYTHQGNPAWAGQERDGLAPKRSNDMFFGGDQPDYIDLNKVAIPQADEQQRLLANLISEMNQDNQPLPKFWYFPKGEKAVLVMAGDDHATATGTKDSFNYMLANSPAGCSVDNWECIRATSLIYESSPLTNQEAAQFTAQGFEIGSHISTGCDNWTPQSLIQAFTDELGTFRSKYTSLPHQVSSRTHCIVWSDWATSPKVELANNIRLDLNYYYWPGSWVQNRPGYFTGSGLPMRFADSDGSMIDVYQLPSHLVNENGASYPNAINLQIDRALGPEGYYGAIGTHYDYSDPFDRQLVQSAKTRGVPMVSAKQMLEWTDARNDSSFVDLAWNGNNFTFNAVVHSDAHAMMRAMLPVHTKNGSLVSITSGSNSVSFTLETIKGVEYAFFPVTSGQYTAAYAIDTTPPTVSSTVPAADATSVAKTTAITATFNEALNPSTVNSQTFTLQTTAGAAIAGTAAYDSASKTAILTPASPLAANTVYTAKLRGGGASPRVEDMAGNALPADVSWSFTTTQGPVCPCSLWPDNPTPATPSVDDPQAVELGVKFSSETAGKITGVRFYKSQNNLGPHTISLWGADGTPLATAAVTSETSSGWQSASFNTPVEIQADTPYVASYFTPTGYYSANSGYFDQPHVAAPLTAPIGAGVYTYGGGFPTSFYNNANYWVSPIFES